MAAAAGAVRAPLAFASPCSPAAAAAPPGPARLLQPLTFGATAAAHAAAAPPPHARRRQSTLAAAAGGGRGRGATSSAGAGSGGNDDDLRRLKGLGPVAEEKLREQMIESLHDLLIKYTRDFRGDEKRLAAFLEVRAVACGRPCAGRCAAAFCRKLQRCACSLLRRGRRGLVLLRMHAPGAGRGAWQELGRANERPAAAVAPAAAAAAAAHRSSAELSPLHPML